MQIALIIFPETEPSHVGQLKFVPRENEKVFVDDNLYEVRDVYYNLDENLIKVMIMKPAR